jgi:hypothetical protein
LSLDLIRVDPWAIPGEFDTPLSFAGSAPITRVQAQTPYQNEAGKTSRFIFKPIWVI